MTSDARPVSTGSGPLDTLLGGGLPASRVTVVAGPAGTGKRALAARFVEAGATEGEDCLYATTAATPPPTADRDSVPTTTLRARDSPGVAGALREWLGERGPHDRVAVDAPTSDGAVVGEVVDVLAERDATGLVVLDGDPPATALADGHALLRTRRERVGDDPHAVLRIDRLAGVDHDRRGVELRQTPGGIQVGPRRRTPPPALQDAAQGSVGVPGLDALCGGGFVRGAGVLLRHDGRADLGALLSTLVAKAVKDGYAVELVPTIGLRADRLDALLRGYDASLSALLDADRLFVLDLIGAWEAGRQNVFAAGDEAEEVKAKLRGIADRTDRPHLRIVNADAMVHTLGEAGARDLRFFEEAALLEPDDLLVHLQNPGVVGDQVAALYEQAATQVLATELTDDGRQYVSLRKSPRGHVGAASLVEFSQEPPFVEVAPPPGRDD